MTSNTIFITLTSILAIAVVIYLIGIKKGKPRNGSQLISMQDLGKTDEVDDDEEGV
ncbi:hypothetical protein KJ786_02575 [Patescibacteria group bacterium]|nr:hypothetical protein [Patescibacteria group bacterium]